MDDSRRIAIKTFSDYLIVLSIGLTSLALYIWATPNRRGFFCNDESLMLPFQFSTITNWMLYIIVIVLPIVLVTITEIVKDISQERSSKKRLQLGSWRVPTWLSESIVQLAVFGFGAVASQLCIDVGKYTVGRLRPHFFSICQPVMLDGTTCADAINHDRYIEEFICVGALATKHYLKEMRLSFPSSHAGLTAYTTIYCAIYLHVRMTWSGSNLLKNLLQFGLILFSFYTSLTRISDYKHHWSDVLAGAVLGSIIALVVVNFVSNLFVRTNDALAQQTRKELSTPM